MDQSNPDSNARLSSWPSVSLTLNSVAICALFNALAFIYAVGNPSTIFLNELFRAQKDFRTSTCDEATFNLSGVLVLMVLWNDVNIYGPPVMSSGGILLTHSGIRVIRAPSKCMERIYGVISVRGTSKSLAYSDI